MTTVDVSRHMPPTTQDYAARLESLLLDEQCNERLAHRIASQVSYGAPMNAYVLVKDIKAEGSFAKNPALWMVVSNFLEQMSAEIENWRPTVAGYSDVPDKYRMLLEWCRGLDRSRWRLDDLLNRLTS